MEQMLIVLAGLLGAAGIALAAAGAHGHPQSGLDAAGYLLVIHAASLLAGAAALHQGLISRGLGAAALTGLAVGCVLFGGDVAMRAFLGHRLFPMAAPSGGFVMIAGWVGVAATALIGRGS